MWTRSTPIFGAKYFEHSSLDTNGHHIGLRRYMNDQSFDTELSSGKRLYATDECHWQAERRSALDQSYMDSLRQFDEVYIWGVLHHTGTDGLRLSTWRPASAKMSLFCWASTTTKVRNRRIERVYRSWFMGRNVVVGMVFPNFFVRLLIGSCLSKRNPFANYAINRAMSLIGDWHDWCGRLPYKVASIEAVLRFFSRKGLILRNIRTTKRRGKQPVSLPATRIADDSSSATIV